MASQSELSNLNIPSPDSVNGSISNPSSMGQTSEQISNSSSFSAQKELSKKRPCDSCRRRKSKCIMLENEQSCVLCRSRNENCTFVEEPLRRKKRKSESIDRDKGSDSKNDQKRSSKDSAITSHGKTATTVDDYAVLKGPSLLKKSLGLQNSRFCSLIGPTGILDQSLISRAEYNSREEAEKELPVGSRLRRVNESMFFWMQEDAMIEGYDKVLEKVHLIEELVAPHGEALIKLYFRVIHPAYPVLHKKVVLEKYKRSYTEFSPPLLGAIYSLALGWWLYSPELESHDRILDIKGNADKLYQISVQTFYEMTKHAKLSTVQAGLLLLQNNKQTGASKWPLLGQVVSLSEDLGLHLDCRDWKIPRWERKLRRRLAWAVWIEDKWTALSHSRPSHLNYKDNWLVAPLTDEDFPDKPTEAAEVEGSSDIEDGRVIFQCMVSLTEIVDDILTTLYSAAAIRDIKDTMTVLRLAKPLQTRLKIWATSLPYDIQMSSLKNRKFSSNGYLYLGYLTAEIVLHRRIINMVAAHNTSSEVVKVCRSAAKERLNAALDFARDLRPEHIQAFWHSSAYSNFVLVGSFASLLLATSDDETESKTIENVLKNYRWVLRVSSAGSELMTVVLQNLDIILTMLTRLNIANFDEQRKESTIFLGTQEHDSDLSEDEEDEDADESMFGYLGDDQLLSMSLDLFNS